MSFQKRLKVKVISIIPFKRTETSERFADAPARQETDEVPYENVRSDNEDTITPAPPTTTFFGTSMNLVNGMMGATYVTFPNLFAMVGLGLGLSSFLIAVVLMTCTLMIIGRAGQRSNAANYQEAVKAYGGNVAGFGTSLTMGVYLLGTCSSYLVIVAEQVVTVVVSSWLTRDVIIIITGMLLFPLMMMPDIALLTWSSTFGVFVLCYVVIIIWWHCIEGIVMTGIHSDTIVVENWGLTLGAAFALYTFALKCHHVCIPIVNKLRNKTQARTDMVLVTGISSCTFLYATTGVLGYLNFGSTVQTDILADNLPNTIGVKIARIALALKCMMSYPLLHFAARMSFADLLGYNLSSLSWRDPEYPKKMYLFLTISFLITSIAIAVSVLHFSTIIELNGAVLGVFQVYFWPAILYFFMQEYPRTLQRYIVTAGIFFICFAVMFFGIYYFTYKVE